jgi:hypothetical protein
LSTTGHVAVFGIHSLRVLSSWTPQELLRATGKQSNDYIGFPKNTLVDCRSPRLPDAVHAVTWWDNDLLSIHSFCGSFFVTPSDALSNLLGRMVDQTAPKSIVLAGTIFDSVKNRGQVLILEQVDTLTESSLQRSFNLVTFTTLTPLEDVYRKLQKEEYGIAAELAVEYQINTDLVYQYQWNSTKAQICPLHILAKIDNLFFVANECLNFIPSTVKAIRELFAVGLKRLSVANIRGTETDTETERLSDVCVQAFPFYYSNSFIY